MALFTVTIAGVSTAIEVYGGATACADYLGGSASSGAVAFRAATSDDKNRFLVQATRYIDQQPWQGAAVGAAYGPNTTLQWPRSGITLSDGTVVDSTTIPQAVINAVFEMAGIIAGDSDSDANVDNGSNVKAVGAGSARVEFWRPQSLLDGNATVMPQTLMRLVGKYLGSASAVIASAFAGVATGTNACSDFYFACDSCGCDPCSCSSGRRDIVSPL